MTIRLPTLSPIGWVEDTAIKADKLMGYFLVSEASQSNLYNKEVVSFPDILRKHQSERAPLQRAVEESLSVYFSRYFDGADAEVTVTDNTQEGKQGWDLNIDLTVIENGKSFNLGRLVSTLNASVMKIVDLNNRGV